MIKHETFTVMPSYFLSFYLLKEIKNITHLNFKYICRYSYDCLIIELKNVQINYKNEKFKECKFDNVMHS